MRIVFLVLLCLTITAVHAQSQYVYLVGEDAPVDDIKVMVRIIDTFADAGIDEGQVVQEGVRGHSSMTFGEFDNKIDAREVNIAVQNGRAIVLVESPTHVSDDVLRVLDDLGTEPILADISALDAVAIQHLFEADRKGCTENDGGQNPDEKGYVIIYRNDVDEPMLYAYHDECENAELHERYCSGGNVNVMNYSCEEGCGNGTCLGPVREPHKAEELEATRTPPIEPEAREPNDEREPALAHTCEGCIVEGACVPIGTRFDGLYCSQNGINGQIEDGTCDADYACISGSCASGTCEQPERSNVFSRVVSFLSTILGL